MIQSRTLITAVILIGDTVTNAVAAEHAWDRFVGSYSCSAEKAYEIEGESSDPTRLAEPSEVILQKWAKSFVVEISVPEVTRRRSDCAAMTKGLDVQINNGSGVAEWHSINVECNSILNLTRRYNNGIRSMEENYHNYGVIKEFVAKDGLDFDQDGGNQFHLSASLHFTLVSHFLDGGIHFTGGNCARVR